MTTWQNKHYNYNYDYNDKTMTITKQNNDGQMAFELVLEKTFIKKSYD